MLFIVFQYCALRKSPVIDGQNACDEISSDIIRSKYMWSDCFLSIPFVEVQMKLTAYSMCRAWQYNNNLEIRIAGNDYHKPS